MLYKLNQDTEQHTYDTGGLQHTRTTASFLSLLFPLGGGEVHMPSLHTKCCLIQTLGNYPSLIRHKALLFLLGDGPKHPIVPGPFAPGPGS